MHVSFKEHLKHGNVWGVEVSLPVGVTPSDPSYTINVLVDIIAPNRDLAQYIVSVMYPDYQSIRIPEEPKFLAAL